MKNNTKVRLHLSKKLFESLTKQVLAEGKMTKEALGGYTEVKEPKANKAAEKMTNKMKQEGLGDVAKKVGSAVKKGAEKAKQYYKQELSPSSVKPGGKYAEKGFSKLSGNLEEEEMEEGITDLAHKLKGLSKDKLAQLKKYYDTELSPSSVKPGGKYAEKGFSKLSGNLEEMEED